MGSIARCNKKSGSLVSRSRNMQFSFDDKVNSIAEKVFTKTRLSFDEGRDRYRTDDLNALGKLADFERRKRHGKDTFYNVNRHFNHTNICVADCKFCGFYRRGRDEDAYTHSIEDAIKSARLRAGVIDHLPSVGSLFLRSQKGNLVDLPQIDLQIRFELRPSHTQSHPGP